MASRQGILIVGHVSHERQTLFGRLKRRHFTGRMYVWKEDA